MGRNKLIAVLILVSSQFFWGELSVADPLDLGGSAAGPTAQAPSVPEEEESPFFTLTSTASMYSAYMFRSQKLYDGLSFQPSLQGTFNLEEYGNLTLIHWMHIPAQGEQYQTRFVEMDEGIAYDFTWEKITFSLTHYWYLYPNGNENTFPGSREFIGTISFDTVLQPYITVAEEYKSYKVQYYELGFKHTFQSTDNEGWNLTPFINFGWATNGTPYWEEDGFVQSTAGISSDITIGNITITPLLAHSNGADGYATDQWWGGVSVAFSM